MPMADKPSSATGPQRDTTLNETMLRPPQDLASPASSPQPKAASPAPSLAAPADVALNETVLRLPQQATLPALSPQPKAEGAAPTFATPADAALNETVLRLPQEATSLASSPQPKAESAAPTLNASADVALNETVLRPRATLPRAAMLDEFIASEKKDALRSPPAEPPQTTRVSGPPALGAWRGPLTRLLTIRLGPMATLIVNRELTAVATLPELIDRLAEKIPSPREQAEFRAQAESLLTRTKL